MDFVYLIVRPKPLHFYYLLIITLVAYDLAGLAACHTLSRLALAHTICIVIAGSKAYSLDHQLFNSPDYEVFCYRCRLSRSMLETYGLDLPSNKPEPSLCKADVASSQQHPGEKTASAPSSSEGFGDSDTSIPAASTKNSSDEAIFVRDMFPVLRRCYFYFVAPMVGLVFIFTRAWIAETLKTVVAVTEHGLRIMVTSAGRISAGERCPASSTFSPLASHSMRR